MKTEEQRDHSADSLDDKSTHHSPNSHPPCPPHPPKPPEPPSKPGGPPDVRGGRTYAYGA